MLRNQNQTQSPPWTLQPGQQAKFPTEQQGLCEHLCCKHNDAGVLQTKFPTQEGPSGPTVVVGPEAFPARLQPSSCRQNHDFLVGSHALQSCGSNSGCERNKRGVPCVKESCQCKHTIHSFAASTPKSGETCCCERCNTVSQQSLRPVALKSGTFPCSKPHEAVVGKLLNPAVASGSGETFCGEHKTAADQQSYQQSYPAIAQASRASRNCAVVQHLQHTVAPREPCGHCCCDEDNAQTNMACSAFARGP